MANRFAVVWFYPNTGARYRIEATNEEFLRELGKDHHQKLTLKPTIHLLNPEGRLIAYMDEWSTDWNENLNPDDQQEDLPSFLRPQENQSIAEVAEEERLGEWEAQQATDREYFSGGV